MNSHGLDPFNNALIDAGVLIPTSVSGFYVHGAPLATATDAISGYLRRTVGVNAEQMRLASVMPRADLERLGYFRNFPHLLGTVHCFCGDEQAHREQLSKHDKGEDWTGQHQASDLVMIPAACYPVYFALARRGDVPSTGYLVNVEANCFRREPSLEPTRLQSFHQQELVRVGAAQDALDFRDQWLERGLAVFGDLGLVGTIAPADDPFFGRAAVVLSRLQRGRALKFELTVAINDGGKPTACMSANYHLDSFGQSVGLTLEDGSAAHSACIGFGIERIALGLFRHHGLSLSDWPHAVRRTLQISD